MYLSDGVNQNKNTPTNKQTTKKKNVLKTCWNQKSYWIHRISLHKCLWQCKSRLHILNRIYWHFYLNSLERIAVNFYDNDNDGDDDKRKLRYTLAIKFEWQRNVCICVLSLLHTAHGLCTSGYAQLKRQSQCEREREKYEERNVKTQSIACVCICVCLD